MPIDPADQRFQGARPGDEDVVEAATGELTAHAAEVPIDGEGLGAEGDEAGEGSLAGGLRAPG